MGGRNGSSTAKGGSVGEYVVGKAVGSNGVGSPSPSPPVGSSVPPDVVNGVGT